MATSDLSFRPCASHCPRSVARRAEFVLLLTTLSYYRLRRVSRFSRAAIVHAVTHQSAGRMVSEQKGIKSSITRRTKADLPRKMLSDIRG